MFDQLKSFLPSTLRPAPMEWWRFASSYVNNKAGRLIREVKLFPNWWIYNYHDDKYSIYVKFNLTIFLLEKWIMLSQNLSLIG